MRSRNGSGWSFGLPSAPLVQSEVHVVSLVINTETDPAGLEWLDDEERSRASRFIRRSDARRFIASHAMLRFVLGRCLDVDPASLRFESGAHGKPALRHPGADIRFNLSRAGERALLAVTIGLDVGVDIERERDIEVMELARRFFSVGEHHALSDFPVSDRLAAFYRCWTRKESFIKARGHGLSFPLDGFEVSVTHECKLIACPAAPSELHRWTIVSLPVDRGYAGALTVEGQGWRQTLWSTALPALSTWSGA